MEEETLLPAVDNRDNEDAGGANPVDGEIFEKSLDFPANKDEYLNSASSCDGMQCDISKQHFCGIEPVCSLNSGSMDSNVIDDDRNEITLESAAALSLPVLDCSVSSKEQLCSNQMNNENNQSHSMADNTDLRGKEKSNQLDRQKCVMDEIATDASNNAFLCNPHSLLVTGKLTEKSRVNTESLLVVDQAVNEVSSTHVLSSSSTLQTPDNVVNNTTSNANSDIESNAVSNATSEVNSSASGNTMNNSTSDINSDIGSNTTNNTTSVPSNPSAEENSPQPQQNSTTGEGGRGPRPALPTRVQVRVQAASPVMFLREQLFLALFQRMAVLYAQSVSRPLQRFIEFILLAQALLSFAALTYIHVVFVREPVNCLYPVQAEWTRMASTDTGGILRVEILRDIPENYSLAESYKREKLRSGLFSPTQDYAGSDAKKESDVRIDIVGDSAQNTTEPELNHIYENISKESEVKSTDDGEGLIHTVLNLLVPSLMDYTDMELNFEDLNIFEYATEFGFLQLTPETRARLNLTVLHVVLDPDKEKCMGRTFARFLLQEFLGYGDVVLSSFQILNPRGYATNMNTGVSYKFVDGPGFDSRTTYISAFFLMILFTLSVSMLLRCSHHQIFIFIVEVLQLLNRMTLITFPIAQLIIAVSALVGIETLMSHIFIEESTAFFVILTVWLADQYDVICCTTNISRRYFLRFFYLYHFLFYAYHCRFQGQFSWMAMICSWLFIQHAMIYIFHHYELPPIIRQAELRRILVHHHATVQQQHGTGQPIVTLRQDAAVMLRPEAAPGSEAIRAPQNTGVRRFVRARRRGGLLGRWQMGNVSVENVTNIQTVDGTASVASENIPDTNRSVSDSNQNVARVGITFRSISNSNQQNTTVGWIQLPSGFSVTSYVVRDGNVEMVDRNSMEQVVDRNSAENIEGQASTDDITDESEISDALLHQISLAENPTNSTSSFHETDFVSPNPSRADSFSSAENIENANVPVTR